MGLLSWLIVGLLAGLVARALVPGAQGMGWIVTTLLGMVGAVAGGFIMGLLGYGGVSGINVWSILVAALGAIVVLLVVRMVRR